MQIKIADTQFAHGTSLGSGDLKIFPKTFQWYRGADNINDMIVVTESMFHKVDEFTEKVKIAWLLEPRSINNESYRQIEYGLWMKFDYILTHNLDFKKRMTQLMEDSKQLKSFDKHPKIVWYPFGGCWIQPQDRQIYPKTKGISIIASGKRETDGHRLRHQAIEALKGKVDVYGRGYNPIEDKLEALRDYKFSIVIENEQTPGFFTEKLIDCFMTGTIPIYWGDTELINHGADLCGFYAFENLDQLIEIVDKINSPEYKNPQIAAAAAGNFFNIGMKFTCPEDWLYSNFFMLEPELRDILIKHNIL